MKCKPWKLIFTNRNKVEEATGLEKEGIYLFTYWEPDPYSTNISVCFCNCELCMPCIQGILYIALRKQICTHVFTKKMDCVNGKGNSNTLFNVPNLMYLYYFRLNILQIPFFLFFFFWLLWPAGGAHKFFVSPATAAVASGFFEMFIWKKQSILYHCDHCVLLMKLI